MRGLTDEQERAVARRRGIAAAGRGRRRAGRPRCSSSASCGPYARTACAPGRILAITFTERAAGELRERVRTRLLRAGRARGGARSGGRRTCAPFHGFCARLLRVHPLTGRGRAGLSDPGRELARRQAANARLRRRARELPRGGARRGGRPRWPPTAPIRCKRWSLGAYAQLRSQGRSEPRLPTPRPRRTPLRGAVLRAVGIRGGRGGWEGGRGGWEGGQGGREGGRGGREGGQGGWEGGDEAGKADAEGREGCARRRPFSHVRSSRRAGRALRRCLRRGASTRAGRSTSTISSFSRASCSKRRTERARGVGRTRFELLMVDEFQDIKPAPARDPRGARPRQPLHGRRRAAVDLQLPPRRREALPRAPRPTWRERGASLALTHNFRSRPAMLAAVHADLRRAHGRALRAAHRRAHGQRGGGPDRRSGPGATGGARRGVAPGRAGGARRRIAPGRA